MCNCSSCQTSIAGSSPLYARYSRKQCRTTSQAWNLSVVLLVKFKSTKQIREVKDAVRFSLDKLSGKAAKEMFEHGHKLEAEYRHLVTAVVAAGANVAHVCAQVKAAVDAEHRKSQWVPVG